jgi:hypothetical protein
MIIVPLSINISRTLNMETSVLSGILNRVFSMNSLVPLFGLWVGYRILLALYNISPLHPLSKVPGPKLAAATFMYEGWFDLVLGGRYTHEIKRMHNIYGKTESSSE